MTTPEVEIEDFIVQIDRVRAEIKSRFLELNESLVARETQLLAELDDITRKFEEKMKAQEGMKTALETTRKLLEENIHCSDLQPLQQEFIARIEDKLKNMQIQIRNCNIELVWRGELLGDVTNLGQIRLKEGFELLSGKIDFKKKEKPVLTCADKGSGEGELDFPWGVSVDYLSSNIYIADQSNNRVQVFSQEGSFLFTFGDTVGAGKMQKPLGICISDGNVFVSQFSGHCIMVYRLDGTFMSRIGSIGKGEGQLNNPYNLAISKANGDIYVCDGGNNRIQVFSSELSFVKILWQNTFRRPVDIKLAQQCIFVLDESSPCLHVFNSDHTPLHSIISRGCVKQVSCSYFFCLDIDRNIYITDYSIGSVLVFDNTGNLVHQFGGLHQPLGIALDLNGRVVVVNSSQENCLQMW